MINDVKKEKMNRTQKIVVTLLILAIIFSVVSLAITFSFSSFKDVKSPNLAPKGQSSGDASGKIELRILPPPVEEG